MATCVVYEYEYVWLNPDGQWVSGFKAWIGYGAECFRDYGNYMVPDIYFE